MHTRFHRKPKLETTPPAPALPFLLPPQQLQMVPPGLEPETLWLLAIRSDQLSYETSCWPLQLLGQRFRLPFLFTHLKSAHHSQSARVIKGVDLRSTAGNCAWVQAPQTLSRVQASCITPSQVHGYFTVSLKSPWPHPCRSDAACLCQADPRLFQNAHTRI